MAAQLNGTHLKSAVSSALGDYASVANGRLALRIPSTFNADVPISDECHALVVESAKKRFNDLFGGSEVNYVSGSFIADDGSEINERVAIVSTLDNISKANADNLLAIVQYAKALKLVLRQESVLLSIEPVQAAFFI